MSQGVQLYSFRRCPFAIRVRMTLHEKQIPFTVHEEDLKNFSETLRILHPEAKVPVLVHGDRVVYESAIIVEYLDEAFPEPPLMPASAGKRAEARLWTYWCNHTFKPDVDRFKYGTARSTAEECVGVENRMREHLARIERALQTSQWLVDNRFSLADITLFPFVRQFFRVTPTPEFLPDYPRVNDWLTRICERPAFTATMHKE